MRLNIEPLCFTGHILFKDSTVHLTYSLGYISRRWHLCSGLWITWTFIGRRTGGRNGNSCFIPWIFLRYLLEILKTGFKSLWMLGFRVWFQNSFTLSIMKWIYYHEEISETSNAKTYTIIFVGLEMIARSWLFTDIHVFSLSWLCCSALPKTPAGGVLDTVAVKLGLNLGSATC